MKKLLFTCLSLMLLLSSCNKDKEVITKKSLDKYPMFAFKQNELQTKGVVSKDLLWENGQTIKIKFVDGTQQQKDAVKLHAKEWLKYANLEFDYVSTGKAHVKISFNSPFSMSYSFVGTEALAMYNLPNMATAYFNNFNPNSLKAEQQVLIMFGHILGLLNEHYNPAQQMDLNYDLIRSYYADEMGMEPDDVETLFFSEYENLSNTEYDPKSIMVWPIDPSFTNSGNGIAGNKVLSQKDKSFIAKLYPKSHYKLMTYTLANVHIFGIGNTTAIYDTLVSRVTKTNPDIFVCYTIAHAKRRELAERLNMDSYFELHEKPAFAPSRTDTTTTTVFLKKGTKVLRQDFRFLERAASRQHNAGTGLHVFELENVFVCVVTASGQQNETPRINADIVNSFTKNFIGESDKPALLIAVADAWYDSSIPIENQPTMVSPEMLLGMYSSNWNYLVGYSHINRPLIPYGHALEWMSIKKGTSYKLVSSNEYPLPITMPSYVQDKKIVTAEIEF